MSRDDLAETGAGAIYSAFNSWKAEFDAITRRASGRFEERDWHGIQADAVQRLDLYPEVVGRIVDRLGRLLGARFEDQSFWKDLKRHYTRLILEDGNREIVETFFNSVTRRIFSTAGVNPEIEFLASPPRFREEESAAAVYERFPRRTTTRALILDVLEAYRFRVGYRSLDRDAALVADEVDRYLLSILGANRIDAIETFRPVFFRNKAAYIIGRILSHRQVIPLVLPLLNTERGVVTDAVLMSGGDVSIVFSFTRSYFHVETARPRDLVVPLKSMMPLKPVAELYDALGFNKHGKTELYRSLVRHLDNTTERFEIARGDPGMVMIVFTLPFYDIVFKVIRDEFEYPKKTTRRDVMDRYRLVFKRDRVGRLVNAQEFEHLKFEKERFSPRLLDELSTKASRSVSVEGDSVVIHHLYTERRVTPLNLYLRDWSAKAARDAVVDYGLSIKDLAAANIFPGDFLLKNFGVTRQGRVVFYDYDELCLLTDCRFRRLPPARSPEEEMEAEPWFTVDDGDIFPEEFERFLGLSESLEAVFREHHRDLFSVEFWQEMQRLNAAGEILDVFPYPERKRLKR